MNNCFVKYKRISFLLVFCLFLILSTLFLFGVTVFMGADDIMIIQDDEPNDKDDDYFSSSKEIPSGLFEETTEKDTFGYNVDLTNLNLYNLVSLQNADIRCHVRGSIWIGGTLTGSQYIDDGSLNGVSPSNSYVYINHSSIYFKSRTNQQSRSAFYLLSAQSVIDTTAYWKNILDILPKDSETIKYIPPDENGYVDLKYWDYQSGGVDNAVASIPILYWTDATKIDMGGLAGHLIAPFADIYITYCNHCGSIVGKTITTDGESHLNYWTPVIETEIETEPVTETETETEIETETETEVETETEQKTSLIIKKTLYCNVWHTECDIMGDEYWVKDEISNPQGIKSKEGHRKDHCGAIDSWYVYLDEYGKPYAMLEMKAGSTNNKIPLPAHFYTDDTYTELRDPATIEVGERIYWTTENKGQVWHHTGVTRLDIPNFEFVIDDVSYFLHPGETLELEVSAGSHTIIEKYDKEYIINDVNVPFSVDKDGDTVITVDIGGSQVEIDFENRPRNMPEPPVPPETEPITETETEVETEIETEIETETETEVETETETEVETETEYQTESDAEQTESETEKITEKTTEKPEEPSTKIPEAIKQVVSDVAEKIKKAGAVLGEYRTRETEPTPNETKKSSGVKGKNRKKNSQPNTESQNLIDDAIPQAVPKTNDDTPLIKLIMMFVLAVIVIFILVYAIKNRRY